MKVYYVSECEQHYYSTLDGAKRAAREEAKSGNSDVIVERLEVGTTKEAFIAALNGVVGVGEVVYTARRKS